MITIDLQRFTRNDCTILLVYIDIYKAQRGACSNCPARTHTHAHTQACACWHAKPATSQCVFARMRANKYSHICEYKHGRVSFAPAMSDIWQYRRQQPPSPRLLSHPHHYTNIHMTTTATVIICKTMHVINGESMRNPLPRLVWPDGRNARVV